MLPVQMRWRAGLNGEQLLLVSLRCIVNRSRRTRQTVDLLFLLFGRSYLLYLADKINWLLCPFDEYVGHSRKLVCDSSEQASSWSCLPCIAVLCTPCVLSCILPGLQSPLKGYLKKEKKKRKKRVFNLKVKTYCAQFIVKNIL